MTRDAQGHQLSGATEEAVTAYDQAVRAFNLVHGDAVGLFDTARQAAPDFAMAHLGKAWVVHRGQRPWLADPGRGVGRNRPALDVERARAGPPRRALPFGARVPGRRRRGIGSPPDALPVRPCGASGCGADRRVPRALSLGPRPVGAGPAVLVQGPAGVWVSAGLPRLWAGGSRRLRAGRGRIARRRRTRTVELLAASYRRTCDGNGGRPEDGLGWMAARAALWSTRVT